MIVASGARYQRLAVDDLERFEGAGVYYAATDLEARVCAGHAVVVVGGGNSAGQAAIYLAQQGSQVSIAIRRDDLAESMSHYLIERIEADPRIELLTQHRGARARAATAISTRSPSSTRRPASGATMRVRRPVLLHRRRSGDRLARRRGRARRPRASCSPTARCPTRSPTVRTFAGRDPLPFETSVPGVFAVGDVRHGR